MHIPPGDLDVLTMGEALIDMISVEETTSLMNARRFERYQGGSPLNIAVNVAKLGGRAAVLAKVGEDAFGRFIRAELRAAGVETAYLRTDPQARTSVVFVSRSKATPDFEPFRDADFRLTPAEVAAAALHRARVIHTSTWPLSREPFRSAVTAAFRQARAMGKVLSLDPNYSRRVWPDRDDALRVLTELLGYTHVTKPSLDDARRLFEDTATPETYVARFHAMGPEIVVLTMGAEGMLLSAEGRVTHIPAHPVAVVDATGAGDAFWAGLLMALLDGHPPAACARFAREIAEIKLTQVGPLPEHLDRQALYARALRPTPNVPAARP